MPERQGRVPKEGVQRKESGEIHYKDNLRDIHFNLFEVFGRDRVLGKKPFENVDKEVATDLLSESRRVAAEMAKSFIADDRHPTVFHAETNSITLPDGFKKAYRTYMDSELYRAGMSEELDGANAPRSVTWAMNELFVGANPSVYLSSALGITVAETLHTMGNEMQKKAAKQIIDNKWGATMVLTEPEAGSDVGAGRVKAKEQPDGTWHISGVKHFITGGDNDATDNIVHLVLARPEGAGPGTKGLSMFMVPKYHFDAETGALSARNGVYTTNVEDKMGIKASPTCELTFGAKEPAVGYLVGDEHSGIAQMFKIIENARMMIGVKSQATLSTAYLNALEFAKTRVQGPDMTQMANKVEKTAIINHPEVRRSLMLQKAYAEGLRSLYLYTAIVQDEIQIVSSRNPRERGDPEARSERDWIPGLTPGMTKEEELKALNAKNDLLLPVVKGFSSERSKQLLHSSLEVLGGSGFLKEYPMEQYIRDSQIDTIYEGTTAIQAKDFFFRKIVGDQMKGGRAFEAMLGEIKDFSREKQGWEYRQLSTGVDLVKEMAEIMTCDLQGSLEPGKAKEIYKVGQNSERLLMAFGDVMVSYLLFRQAEVAKEKLQNVNEKDKAFYEGKIVTAKFFAREVLPRLLADRQSTSIVTNDIMDLPHEAL